MIAVQGLVHEGLTLTADQLRSDYPAHTVSSQYANNDRVVKAEFTGARLWDVLQRAGVTPPLRVEARARDDFRCLLKWDEIDPDAPDSRGILIAYDRDGAPLLVKDGPLRLVVPGDETGVRYLRGLHKLTVLALRHSAEEDAETE